MDSDWFCAFVCHQTSVLSWFIPGKVAFFCLQAVETWCFSACFDQAALHEYQTWPCGERERGWKDRGPWREPAASFQKQKPSTSHSLYTCHQRKEKLFRIITSGMVPRFLNVFFCGQKTANFAWGDERFGCSGGITFKFGLQSNQGKWNRSSQCKQAIKEGCTWSVEY